MLDKPWTPDVIPRQQPLYQPVQIFTYWPVLRYFNNWNIIAFSHKSTTSEAFEYIQQVFLDRISENMTLLVQYGKYGATNTTYSTTMGYFVINFVSKD